MIKEKQKRQNMNTVTQEDRDKYKELVDKIFEDTETAMDLINECLFINKISVIASIISMQTLIDFSLERCTPEQKEHLKSLMEGMVAEKKIFIMDEAVKSLSEYILEDNGEIDELEALVSKYIHAVEATNLVAVCALTKIIAMTISECPSEKLRAELIEMVIDMIVYYKDISK